MTNMESFDIINPTNPVLTVAPTKEETEMLRATDKITALYCRLSVEDAKLDKDKNGGKEDPSNSIQHQKSMLLQYAKENRFPNPVFFIDEYNRRLIQYNGVSTHQKRKKRLSEVGFPPRRAVFCVCSISPLMWGVRSSVYPCSCERIPLRIPPERLRIPSGGKVKMCIC